MFSAQIQLAAGPDLPAGNRVAVYRNLHRSAWSIRSMEGPHKGKVAGYAQAVALTGCHMHVNPRAQLKIANGGARQVHAWIIGRLADVVDLNKPQRITYQPHHRAEFFVVSTGRAIWTAPAVVFTDAAYIDGPA